ncbi:MAG: class I SAM-dependent methyltransferase [Desulfosarcinaceae bacterium]|nr:class I SAM-dependent methyltransferase [Desulfosarcinaceae bacterium]
MDYYPPRYLFRRYELLRVIQRGKEFLEIGPGNLFISKELLAFFERGILVDFNAESRIAFDGLGESHQKRLTLEIKDIFRWNTSRTFDCVVACEVLEHIDDDKRFLKKLYALLKPSGQLVLSVPARAKFWSLHDELVGHLRRYEKADIIQILNDSGFKEVKVIAYGYPFINLLRHLRIWLARKQAARKRAWSYVRRTKESGFVKGGKWLAYLGIVVNPMTVLPFARIASRFNRRDLSCGYLITARAAKSNER